MGICPPIAQRPRVQIPMLTLDFAEINHADAIRVNMAPDAW